MTLVIGTDEAGYGPNLGPLVVAASLWRVAAPPTEIEASLAAAVSAATAAVAARGGGRMLWADSKHIYKPHAITALEHGVLVALAATSDAVPCDWPSLVGQLAATAAACGPDRAARDALAVPLAGDAAFCLAAAEPVRVALGAAGVTLCGLACRIVEPSVFNRLLDEGLNKSDILSQTTLTLAAAGLEQLRGRFPDEPALIWCDRHGGRKNYAALVTRHLDCPLVQTAIESADRSAYDLPAAACRIEFTVGGEARGPVALASMTAKYVREVAMHAFNAFWGSRSPGLAPTAGYPVDAARWRRDAAAALAAAGVAADDFWRRA
jgi:hypothetical protein